MLDARVAVNLRIQAALLPGQRRRENAHLVDPRGRNNQGRRRENKWIEPPANGTARCRHVCIDEGDHDHDPPNVNRDPRPTE